MDKICSVCGFPFYDLKIENFDWNHFHIMGKVSCICPTCGEHLYFSSVIVVEYIGDKINELDEIFHLMRIVPLICCKCDTVITQYSAVCHKPGLGEANWIAGQANLFQRN